MVKYRVDWYDLVRVAGRIVPVQVRKGLRRWITNEVPVSCGYEIVEGEAGAELLRGWQDPEVAARQWAAFLALLRKMYEGNVREDFAALANAVRITGVENPLIIEVGCGSGWNSEVLTYLLMRPIRYIGLDYSPAMTVLGRWYYPDVPFVVGDATWLPFKDGACDILVSGTVLMHLLGYRRAIQESRRVAQKYCIFHTVPVVQKRSTTILKKFAYGNCVVEIIFKEEELLQLISDSGFVVLSTLGSVPYDLHAVLGEPMMTRTYVCKIE